MWCPGTPTFIVVMFSLHFAFTFAVRNAWPCITIIIINQLNVLSIDAQHGGLLALGRQSPPLSHGCHVTWWVVCGSTTWVVGDAMGGGWLAGGFMGAQWVAGARHTLKPTY